MKYSMSKTDQSGVLVFFITSNVNFRHNASPPFCAFFCALLSFAREAMSQMQTSMVKYL